MKSLAEVRQFYYNDIIPKLDPFEKKRKIMAHKLKISRRIIVIIGIALFFTLKDFVDIFWLLVFIIIGVIWLLFTRHDLLTKDYTINFKDVVIQPIVTFVDDSLIYHKSNHIPLDMYNESMLFDHFIPGFNKRYNGDDLVVGKLGNTDIMFSELHTEYKGGDEWRYWKTEFKGLFFIGNFNKDFKGKTFVLPETAENHFISFGSMFQKKKTSHVELIKLENPDFEKQFKIYGTDQVEARYILSPNLMERILHFMKKYDKDLRLSFVNGAIFIAIEFYHDIFEPKEFITLTDFSPIEEYYSDLLLALSIVEDLNLNTRIWTKE